MFDGHTHGVGQKMFDGCLERQRGWSEEKKKTDVKMASGGNGHQRRVADYKICLVASNPDNTQVAKDRRMDIQVHFDQYVTKFWDQDRR